MQGATKGKYCPPQSKYIIEQKRDVAIVLRQVSSTLSFKDLSLETGILHFNSDLIRACICSPLGGNICRDPAYNLGVYMGVYMALSRQYCRPYIANMPFLRLVEFLG